MKYFILFLYKTTVKNKIAHSYNSAHSILLTQKQLPVGPEEEKSFENVTLTLFLTETAYIIPTF